MTDSAHWPTVLLLEDDDLDAELIIAALKRDVGSLTLIRARSEPGYRASLLDDAVALVLSDFSLPGYDGFAALAAAKEARPELPFIFVSGAIGEERAIDVMRRGAIDYVLKHRLERLGPAVRRALDESESRRLRKIAESERDRLLVSEREAREAAESANRLKDEFLAIVSHELRTPLNAISGWASILATGLNDEDKKRRAVDAILRNAQMQTRIIDDILDVSRIVSGKLELVRSPVSLAAVVRAAVESVRPSAAAKDLRLRLELGDESATVHVDAERMQQVVWNLLVNAVKFTAAGGSVCVSVRANDGQAVLEVADDGIGIDAALLPHVFQAFRQGDSSKTRSHGGLGLGLSIVRHLVEMQGGTVRAASEGKARGATFTVQMPIAIEDATAKSLTLGARKHVAGTVRALSPAALRGVRVLVVDDEPEAREILNEVLSTLGAEVVTAGSVSEALDTVTSFRPDVLVSDIGMPEVDGYSLARKLRALPAEAGGQIPAVALTAYARAIDRIEAERAGYQRHLAKPVSPNALVATLVELLGRASVPPPANE